MQIWYSKTHWKPWNVGKNILVSIANSLNSEKVTTTNTWELKNHSDTTEMHLFHSYTCKNTSHPHKNTFPTHMQASNYHLDLNCRSAILLLYSFILCISNASKHGDKC